jgi:hypothetical protein
MQLLVSASMPKTKVFFSDKFSGHKKYFNLTGVVFARKFTVLFHL